MVVVTYTLAVCAKTGDILFYLYPFQGNSHTVVTLIDWFTCLMPRVHSRETFVVYKDKITYSKMVIKQQILQFIVHTVNGDGSNNANIIKKLLTPITLTFRQCYCY